MRPRILISLTMLCFFSLCLVGQEDNLDFEDLKAKFVKMSPRKSGGFCRELRDRGEFVILEKLAALNHPNAGSAMTFIVDKIKPAEIIAKLLTYDLLSPQWRAIVERLGEFPKEHVLGYLRHMVFCSKAEVRAYIYMACTVGKWDDVSSAAVQDIGNGTMLLDLGVVPDDSTTVHHFARTYLKTINKLTPEQEKVEVKLPKLDFPKDLFKENAPTNKPDEVGKDSPVQKR